MKAKWRRVSLTSRSVINFYYEVHSFICFPQAANPDWNPSDPTGSLYLNRIAGATNQMYGITRRRNRERERAGHESVVHFAGEPPIQESTLEDRAQEYDRALRQSQFGAASRRRIGASMLGASVMGAAGAPSASSIFGGYSQTAQTAILGDSQGSIHPDQQRRMPAIEDSLPSDELEVSGSGLGGSYIDGAKRSKPFDDTQEEEDVLQDGGVLGLLAQIYGKHEGGGGVL
jgi:autophagy-related protein 9